MFRFLLAGPLIIIFCLSLETRADDKLPDFEVADEFGRSGRMETILGENSLLVLGYYNCRHICHDTIHKLDKKLRRFSSYPKVVFLSLKGDEGPGDALRAKKKIYGPEKDKWSFLVAEEKDSRKLAKALDFSFKDEPVSGSLTHENTIFQIRSGKVARRFQAQNFTEKDLEVKSMPSKFFDYKQFCSEFDPSKSKYGILILNVLSGISALFVMMAGLGFYYLRKRSA